MNADPFESPGVRQQVREHQSGALLAAGEGVVLCAVGADEVD